MKPVRVSPGNQAFLPGMPGTITLKTQKRHLESSILHFFLLVVRSLTNAVHRWHSFQAIQVQCTFYIEFGLLEIPKLEQFN